MAVIGMKRGVALVSCCVVATLCMIAYHVNNAPVALEDLDLQTQMLWRPKDIDGRRPASVDDGSTEAGKQQLGINKKLEDLQNKLNGISNKPFTLNFDEDVSRVPKIKKMPRIPYHPIDLVPRPYHFTPKKHNIKIRFHHRHGRRHGHGKPLQVRAKGPKPSVPLVNDISHIETSDDLPAAVAAQSPPPFPGSLSKINRPPSCGTPLCGGKVPPGLGQTQEVQYGPGAPGAPATPVTAAGGGVAPVVAAAPGVQYVAVQGVQMAGAGGNGEMSSKEIKAVKKMVSKVKRLTSRSARALARMQRIDKRKVDAVKRSAKSEVRRLAKGMRLRDLRVNARLKAELRSVLRAVGKGKPGRRGYRGRRGARGQTGHRGAPGPRGQTGKRGHTGRRGAPGPIGRQGLPGWNGVHGRRGNRGHTGKTGRRGQQGKQGARGTRGPRGLTGARGPSH